MSITQSKAEYIWLVFCGFLFGLFNIVDVSPFNTSTMAYWQDTLPVGWLPLCLSMLLIIWLVQFNKEHDPRHGINQLALGAMAPLLFLASAVIFLLPSYFIEHTLSPIQRVSEIYIEPLTILSFIGTVLILEIIIIHAYKKARQEPINMGLFHNEFNGNSQP